VLGGYYFNFRQICQQFLFLSICVLMIKSLLMVGNFLSRASGTPAPGEELRKRLICRGWQVWITSEKPNKIFRLLDMIITIWSQKHKYIIAHIDVFSGPAFFWAEAAATMLRLLDKPYILTLHGGNLPNFAYHWPGRVRRLLAGAAAVTVPSAYLFHAMQPYRRNLLLLPNPLETSRYNFQVREQPSPRLIWLRAFHEIYNPSLAPRALAFLTKTSPEVSLTMIGPDKGDGSLPHTQNVAGELGVCDHLRFSGKIPKEAVPSWMNQGDIFLNTTNIDNTPVSVMEAMACGLCVVSTNVGGIPYLLEHEADALLVPPNNPEAMAQAVQRILTEPGLAKRLSRNARKKAEHYDWSNILPKWEALLTAVAQGHKS
jgi:glycosyltransferase involved in cell wall biosynthesis